MRTGRCALGLKRKQKQISDRRQLNKDVPNLVAVQLTNEHRNYHLPTQNVGQNYGSYS